MQKWGLDLLILVKSADEIDGVVYSSFGLTTLRAQLLMKHFELTCKYTLTRGPM